MAAGRAGRQRSGQCVFPLYHSHRVLSIGKLYKDLREKYPEIGQNFFKNRLTFRAHDDIL